jgi:hypothetical protein
MRRNLILGLMMTMVSIPALGCMVGGTGGTVIPAGRPADFEVQTITPTPHQAGATRPAPVEEGAAVVAVLGDAPTHTPDPNAPPTVTPRSTATLAATPTTSATIEAALPKSPAATPAPAKPTVSATLDPPLAGGSWDFEANFEPWGNPFGEPCPGASVGSGWVAFTAAGQYGSSCFNENLYQPNVFSGLKSQEITFDFIDAHSGVLRTIPTQIGHQYNIMAYAKHDHSISPIEMALGVDLTGGTEWSAESVQWFPWDGTAEDTWLLTEKTVTATGESMTIFIKGFHPQGDQGGKTVIDNVSVTDLGL